jgi:hypothetical protein
MSGLAGDLFRSLEQMETLANNPGKGPDTSEALDYARYVKLGRRQHQPWDTDHEKADNKIIQEQAAEDHRYSASSYGAKTREFVDNQYYLLADDNPTHFPTPRGADASKPAEQREGSAGSTYRSHHELAITRAVAAGKNGSSLDPAMAAEGFGAHFLSDACSSGHLTTQRTDIKEYWNARDPGLNDHFQAYLTTQVVAWVQDNLTKFVPGDPELLVYDSTRDAVQKAFSKFPPLTLGALVGLAVHDLYNRDGVNVLVGGDQKRIYGDGHLEDGDTKDVAVAAVKAGIADIQEACRLGRQGKSAEEAMAKLLGGGSEYAPELLLPRLPGMLDMRASNGPGPRWMVNSFEDLVADPLMKKGLELTIRNNVDVIAGVAASLGWFKKKAIMEGFVEPVRANPIKHLCAIYHYDGHADLEILQRADDFKRQMESMP